MHTRELQRNQIEDAFDIVTRDLPARFSGYMVTIQLPRHHLWVDYDSLIPYEDKVRLNNARVIRIPEFERDTATGIKGDYNPSRMHLHLSVFTDEDVDALIDALNAKEDFDAIFHVRREDNRGKHIGYVIKQAGLKELPPITIEYHESFEEERKAAEPQAAIEPGEELEEELSSPDTKATPLLSSDDTEEPKIWTSLATGFLVTFEVLRGIVEYLFSHPRDG